MIEPMPKGDERLAYWQERYDECFNEYIDTRNQITANMEQYEGSKKTDKNGERGADVTIGRNMTFEMIESQISSSIPIPKVTPKKIGERYERNARTIEAWLTSVKDQLPFEYLHDESSRTVPITGGNFFLVEWDNGITTRETVGDVTVQSVSPAQFTPQKGVCWLHRMGYLFMEFVDTRDRIFARYGVDTTMESNDDININPMETVKVVVCYYINDDGGIGEFRWVGNTVLADLEDCQSRYWKVCESCGKAKPYNSNECTCGSSEWVKQPKDYEELTEDIQLEDRVIPALSEAKDENGNVILETVEAFDEFGNPITVEVPKMVPTRIPYYMPRKFPVVLQKNTSKFGKLLGDSDCEQIHDIQVMINQLLDNVKSKLLKGGSLITLPDDLEVEIDGTVGKIIKFSDIASITGINHFNLTTDVQQDLMTIDHLYNYAKRILGISDSFQGMPDRTAESGTAKQLQVMQSAGRLESKRVMADAAYADLYHVMFQFMLAYSDEPRQFRSEDINGKPESRIFNRYDFLEQDATGNWYYDDSYTFSTDISGSLANNRQMMWQETRLNYQSGAFGNPQDPLVLKIFWEEMESLHYPNASRVLQRLDELIAQQQEIQQMQQALQQNEQSLAEQQGVNQQLSQQLESLQGERDEYADSIGKANETLQSYEQRQKQMEEEIQRAKYEAYMSGIAAGNATQNAITDTKTEERS